MTKTIKGLRLTIEGVTHDLSLDRFMFSEAMALEEEWGLTVMELSNILAAGGSPPLRVVGSLVWLMQVRAEAVDTGVSFTQAAKARPAGEFDFNLANAALETVMEPENPTSPATRTPATRTTRATSAKKGAKRNSVPAAAATSESSPSS